MSESITEVSDRLLVEMAKQSTIPEDKKFDLVDVLELAGLGHDRTKRAAVYSTLLMNGLIRPFEAPSEDGREGLRRFRLTALGLTRGLDLKREYSRMEVFRRGLERWTGLLVLITLLVTTLAAYFSYLAASD